MPARLSLIALCALTTVGSASAQSVDFNRDIRPILSGKCFQCHGPDDKVRQAGLRFDLRDGATKVLKSGTRAIVPGDAANSEMAARISVTDGEGVMPPTKTGTTSSAAEM